jgi:hypothetical protein
MPHDESCLLQGAVDSGHEAVDVGRRKSEEIEVSRLSPNVAARDQRRAAGRRKVLGLGEAGDDRGNLLLQRSEHLPGAAAILDPGHPRLPNLGRQDELIPELEQVICVDVEADVVLRALT